MVDIFEKLNWKILVLILLGVFGLIVLMGNVANRSFETTASKELPTSAPTKTEIRTNSSSFPDSSFSTWKFYKTDKYELTYPSDWKIEKRRIVNGGELVIFKAEKESLPVLTISSEPASKSATLEQKRRILKSLGFSENSILFNNLEAWEFNVTKKTYSEKRLFISKGGNNFNIEYKYDSNNPKETINRIFSSFKFQ